VSPLADQAYTFAAELQSTLDACLPRVPRLVVRSLEGGERFVVEPDGQPSARTGHRIDLSMGGRPVAFLTVRYHLDLDHRQTYLKVVRSDIHLFSTATRSPILRLEYANAIETVPSAHWQVHAESGALTHLLTLGHANGSARSRKPFDLSTLHLPLGGERFRPCLEDVLEFVIVELGVDRHAATWRTAVEDGREAWRRKQLASAVRDSPDQAAKTLVGLGYEVTPPDPPSAANRGPMRAW
jgi:hypothetical protein